MDFNLLVDRERLEIGDLIAMEEGSLKAQRDVLASCLTDENDVYLPKADAIAKLNKLNAKEFANLVKQMLEAMQNVPLATGTE